MKTFNPQTKTIPYPMKLTLLPALRRLLPLLVLLLALPGAQAQNANPPGQMSFQGYLTDQSGNPLGATNTGPKNYTVYFRIWDIPTGGSQGIGGDELHAEQQVVTVNNGYFSILLGQGSSVSSSEPFLGTNLAGIFTGPKAASRYVEMTVLGLGSNPVTLSPRLQLVSSPYAYLAANAVTAGTAGGLINTNGNGPVLTVSPGNSYVGIGTTTPSQELEVNGNEQLDGTLYLQSTLGDKLVLFPQSSGGQYGLGVQGGQLQLYCANSQNITFGQGTSASFSEKMRINGNGYVGINTNSPAQALEVNGIIQSDSGLINNGNLNQVGKLAVDYNGNCNVTAGGANSIFNYGISFGSGGTGEGIFCNRVSGGINNNGLTFCTGYQPRLAVANNGNVGIGTISPGATLEVNGNEQLDGGLTLNNGQTISAKNSSGSLDTFLWPRWSDNITYLNYGSGGFNIRNNSSTTTMFMNNSGQVGIGTASPGQALEVNGWIQADGDGHGFRLVQDGNNANGKNGSTGYTEARICWDSQGQQVSDSSRTSDGGLCLCVYNSSQNAGWSTAEYDGDNNWDFYSDRRLKTDIKDAEPMLTALKKVQFRRYHMIGALNTNRFQLGVIAQELKDVFPDMVKSGVPYGEKEARYKVSYTQFGTVACKAIQELAAQVDTDEATVQTLTQRVQTLEAQNKKTAELEIKAAQVDDLARQVADLKKLVAQLALPNAAQNTARTGADAATTVAASTR